MGKYVDTDNGATLREELGLAEDVRFAAQVDVLTEVPRVTRTYELPSGPLAAVLQASQ